jgi:hypothetical protein
VHFKYPQTATNTATIGPIIAAISEASVKPPLEVGDDDADGKVVFDGEKVDVFETLVKAGLVMERGGACCVVEEVGNPSFTIVKLN